jgi:hypothetical protein
VPLRAASTERSRHVWHVGSEVVIYARKVEVMEGPSASGHELGEGKTNTSMNEAINDFANACTNLTGMFGIMMKITMLYRRLRVAKVF